MGNAHQFRPGTVFGKVSRPQLVMNWITVLTAIAFAGILIFALSTLVGCNSQDIADARAEVTATRQRIEQVEAVMSQAVIAKDQADQMIAALPPESPDKATYQAISEQAGKVIKVAQDWLPKAQESLKILETQLATATDGLDVADAGIKAAAPLIPAPFGTIATFAGGLIVGLIRAWQNRQAARNIAKSVELAQSSDGSINFDDEATKDNLRTIQGATASRIVDEAQGKALALPV